MPTYFGAIADDFTGATDLAGLLARSGLHVSLRMGLPTEPPAETAPIEIIALKCRTLPSSVAVAETLAALQWLRDAGAEHLYWKYCSTFDSTSRGNIGPVAEALMTALGADQTVYCPAFPENGRSVFMGYLFVGKQLLAESPMKDHPLTPMRDSNLVRLLQPQVKARVGLANRTVVAAGPEALRARLAQLRAEGVAHVVVDAVADDDLGTIARGCQGLTLMTGGSALAKQLPGIWIKAGRLSPLDSKGHHGRAEGPAIVLSGSCSAATNRQVAAYLAKGRPGFRLEPLDVAETGAEPVLTWLAAQRLASGPLIYATDGPEGVRAVQEKLGAERAGELVERVLAACAAAARDLGYRRFVVAGGESSGAVTNALELNQLDVGREIAPGVPWCFARSADTDIAVALKSGNFGADDFFSHALETAGR